MDDLDRIGPVLGVAAFLGFAILAFLVFMQAREIRRLREWAGRAPERKLEADEATQAAVEAGGELEDEGTGRLAGLRERTSARLAPLWEGLDRNSPVDPRWLVAALVAGLIAAAALTSGFGLLGDDAQPGAGGNGETKTKKEDKLPKVAVLNATQTESQGVVLDPVPNLAAEVASQVVEAEGYKAKTEQTAVTGEEQTVIMYEEGFEREATEFADAIAGALAETPTEPMIQEVRDLAKGAPLALLIGLDDAEFGSPEPPA